MTTTTTTSMTETRSQPWKLISGLLALAVIFLIAAVGVESYYFYRITHHPTSVRHEALAHSSAQNTSSAHIDPLTADDWDLPNASLSAGNPWNQLNRLHQQMNQLFNDTFSQFPADNPALLSAVSPNLDVREEKQWSPDS